MAIVYKKSALGTFLEQLPEMMLKYRAQTQEMQFQKNMLEDKQAHDAQMRSDDREFQREVDLYKDAKAEERDSRNKLDALMTDYQKSGAQLNDLNELFATTGALKVLDDVNKIPAENYAELTKAWYNKAEQHDAQAKVLKEVLYGDIAKAQQIASGGRPGLGYQGGENLSRWDMEDINYEAYEAEYGENKLVENMFENIPGSLRKSLMELEASEVDAVMKQAKGLAYKTKYTEDEQEDLKNKANTFFGKVLLHGSIESGLDQYYSSAAVIQDSASYEDEDVESNKMLMQQAAQQIGMDMAQLTGEATDQTKLIKDASGRVIGSEQLDELFEKYRSAHGHGASHAEPNKGVTGEAEFSFMEAIIEDSWKNYKTKDEATRKELDEVAKRLFGYDPRITFGDFIEQYNEYRLNDLVSMIGGDKNGLLDKNDIEDDGWGGLW